MGKTWLDITKKWFTSLQLDLKQIHKVKFYPSDNNFTQALLVMLVTNMISGTSEQLQYANPPKPNLHLVTWRIKNIIATNLNMIWPLLYPVVSPRMEEQTSGPIPP